MTTTTGGVHPRAWYFAEDGATVSGRFLELAVGANSVGTSPIAVLNVDGEPRSIWLAHSVLRAAFSAELARRHQRNFRRGERITIERGEKIRGRTAGSRAYWGVRRYLSRR